ncbi:alpha-1,4-glucan--maltose-1-phosphate maltosyltransferase [Mumia zhuanghuii]|uniref:Alpha-1,4-glucan:maltose-1-phosphate maltosyltransferase n=2 Tax=Mumia TaxID=1546255 RepID=A0ABW1QVT7_9ACTN|nr:MULTISPECIES: alpha-1,4-glucan--maltose-1-phosphate maltosyltransferase [Mumia]KAA1420358.1 alpha-1,4-glucan--maltose-1-phosphate maltosyltransferase [Mumia zhuanghuii]
MLRIPVMDVCPVVEHGAYAAKAAVGEPFPIRARIFREGHDALGAGVVLTGPDRRERAWIPLPHLDNDHHEVWVTLDAVGAWSYRIETWSDPFGTWLHDAPVKVAADVDTELMPIEGALLLERAATALPRGRTAERTTLRAAAKALRDRRVDAAARLDAATAPDVLEIMSRYPVRDLLESTQAYPVFADRERALSGAWYELFPRSYGGLRGAIDQLDRVAAMGFDVVYLPPIHPIGRVNRKGRNNSLHPEPGDPGSPWAIGAAEGGHDAIHPELGTDDDLAAFVAATRDRGMEVALDLALQCAPDHPWVAAHPEWFTTRADGTIAYAENPPKKYQDIYPLNFDNDPEGLYAEVLRVVRHWMDRGIRIFRVDNPHTKPVPFWERLLAEVRRTDPDVLFLAEAFTRPAMMRALGTVGFHQSYTYFTWRETKDELSSYLEEVSGRKAHVMRSAFWVNTPDILPTHLQAGDPAMFRLRAVLAATGTPTWGMYSGFEILEHTPLRPGSEEYLDSEKYEVRHRDFDVEHSIAPFIARLNEIRREHPALQQLHRLRVHENDADQVLCYSRRHLTEHRDDAVIVVANLEPHVAHETTVHLDLPALGIGWGERFAVRDELTGQVFDWGEDNYVRLGGDAEVAHVLTVLR